MRARTLASLPVAAAFILPAQAAGHDAPLKGLTAAERHRATDLAGMSVPTLERRVRTLTRRLGRQPGTRAGGARLAATGDPGLVGSWSQVIPAPVVPIFEALLPNGKILLRPLGQLPAGDAHPVIEAGHQADREPFLPHREARNAS